MKSVIFIVLTLLTLLSADLNGAVLYGAEENSLSSLVSDSGENQNNENILSDEDTAYFSSSYIITASLCGFSCCQVSNTILPFYSSIFQPPQTAIL